MKRYAPFILLAGDVLALLLFVAAGQRDHEMVNPENPIGGVLMTGSVFVLPWLVVAWLVGAYAVSESGDHAAAGVINSRAIILHGLNAWLIAAPLAILLRAAILGRAIIPTIFMAVAMGIGGAFVIGWRMLFVLVVWLLQRRSPEGKPLQGPT